MNTLKRVEVHHSVQLNLKYCLSILLLDLTVMVIIHNFYKFNNRLKPLIIFSTTIYNQWLFKRRNVKYNYFKYCQNITRTISS